MRCTFCLSPQPAATHNCAVCGAPLALNATTPLLPTSSTRSAVAPPKQTNSEIELSHVITIKTARDVLATTFLHHTRRDQSAIASLLDDGSVQAWRYQNRDIAQIEERELLAPLRHAPTLAAFNQEIAWSAHDKTLTLRSFASSTSAHATSSTRCCERAFSTPICRLAASRKSAHIAVATADGQVHLMGFENDEIASLWSVDTLSGVTALAISEDAAKIAVGKDSGHLALHNRLEARDCWTTDTHSLWVAGAAFSPNAHALAIADCNGVLQIRAAQNSASLQKISLDFAPQSLSFLDDNRHLISADAHQFSLVDSWTGRTVSQTLKTQNHETAKSASVRVCNASEENVFAVCRSRAIQLWRF